MINISGRNASSNKLPPILIERSSIFTCPQPTKGVQQPADTLVRWTSSKPAWHSCSWRSCSLGFSIDPIQSNPKVLPEIPPSQMELFDFIIFSYSFEMLFSNVHFQVQECANRQAPLYHNNCSFSPLSFSSTFSWDRIQYPMSHIWCQS